MVDSFKRQVFVQILISLGIIVALAVSIQLIALALGNASNAVENQKTELAFRNITGDSLAALKTHFEETKPLLDSLNNALPPKDQLIDFGKELSLMAQKRKIDLGFAFGGEVGATPNIPGSIRFSLTGNSSYANVSAFLKDLEKAPFYVKINSLDIAKQPRDAFNFLINGQVFHQ